jgi:hypothetical protein
MGILDFFMGIQDPVDASYRVTSATKPPTESSVANCDMVGEVTAPGLKPRVVEHNSPFTDLDKWPRPGDVLPVLVDRDNPDFMKVKWKEVPERAQ